MTSRWKLWGIVTVALVICASLVIGTALLAMNIRWNRLIPRLEMSAESKLAFDRVYPPDKIHRGTKDRSEKSFRTAYDKVLDDYNEILSLQEDGDLSDTDAGRRIAMRIGFRPTWCGIPQSNEDYVRLAEFDGEVTAQTDLQADFRRRFPNFKP